MTGNTLGIVMIARDEERNLERSLGPLAALADEAVVLDTGSGDRTAETARRLGARVHEAPWRDDFALARNLALDRATTDYVLWLDADNSMDPGDFLSLRRMVAERPGPAVFVLQEEVEPQGDRLWQKRAFPRAAGFLFVGSVHEQLAHPEGVETVFTDLSVLHWGYADPVEAARKGERNLRLLLADPLTRGGDFYRLYQTGRTLLNLRRHAEALQFLERAASRPASNLSLWSHSIILRSGVLSLMGREREAIAALEGLLGARPDYGPGRFYLGKLLHRAGRDAEAARELRLALGLGLADPGWGSAPERLGFTCAQLLGRILGDLGDLAGAASALSQAAAFAPGNPEPKVALAEMALREGRALDAAGLLERALELAPFHRRARELSLSLGRPQ